MKRKKIRLKYKKERVLFSDVLPYELPFIFTNRYFYRFLVRNEIQWNEKLRVISWNKEIEEGALLILDILLRQSITNITNGTRTSENATLYDDIKNDSINIAHLKVSETIPFTYNILHKPTKCRQLAIIHPLNQIKIVDFYNTYKNSIIYLCSKSNFSIRYPEKVACYFFYKDRLHHTLLGEKADSVEMFFSEYENLKTFFSYKKYNNIYKFYEDYRYQRAEKKYEYLLKFDIQSCFDSIYTHSIAWAISGGADIYKDTFDGEDLSIGSQWDRIMREMNYNETNGIIIGPEFSRLFAEVILQHIDQRVEKELEKKGYKNKVHYECYRYVDDYFFFANDEHLQKVILELYDKILKEYKLTLSNEKKEEYKRPFITKITKAKIEIDELLNSTLQLSGGPSVMEEDITEEDELDQNTNNIEAEEIYKSTTVTEQQVKECLNTKYYFKFKATQFNKRYKKILSDNDVEYKDVINYTLVRIVSKIVRILKKYDKVLKPLCIVKYSKMLSTDQLMACEKQINTLERNLSQFLFEVIDTTFFLHTMNKRINTTLKTLQILNAIIIYVTNDYKIVEQKNKKHIPRFTEYIKEIICKKIRDEISLVLQTSSLNTNNQLETLYFLIILKQLGIEYQLTEKELRKYIGLGDGITQEEKTKNIEYLSSFNAIAIANLLYYVSDIEQYKRLKGELIKGIKQKFNNIPEERRKKSAEYVILALDLAACPFLENDIRETILSKVGVKPNDAQKVITYFKKQKFMFTQWTGVNITKELNAKISQEVYA